MILKKGRSFPIRKRPCLFYYIKPRFRLSTWHCDEVLELFSKILYTYSIPYSSSHSQLQVVLLHPLLLPIDSPFLRGENRKPRITPARRQSRPKRIFSAMVQSRSTKSSAIIFNSFHIIFSPFRFPDRYLTVLYQFRTIYCNFILQAILHKVY